LYKYKNQNNYTKEKYFFIIYINYWLLRIIVTFGSI